MKPLKLTAFVLLGIALGFFGLSLLFSDLGPGETITSRLTTAGLFYLASGMLIGFFNASLWPIAGVIAWGAIILGLGGFFGGRPDLFEDLLLPAVALVPTFLGGYLGALLNRKRVFPRLFRRG